jgi:adenylate cyclase
MATDDVKRKLTAIFSADVEGYSRLMEEDELATVETLTSPKEIMRKLIRQYRGRVVDSTGDNLLAEFGSVVDAVQCAVEVQQVLSAKNELLPENRRMYFRIGINSGDVIEEGELIYGDGVNVAARVESLAEGGGISISGTAFDQLGKKLPLGYEYLGEQAVKNIRKPVRVYRVLTETEAVGKVIGELKPKTKQLRGAAIGGIVVLILVLGALALWNFYLRPDVVPASIDKMAYPLPDKPSIAVLPFTNLSGDSKQEYFSDGLANSIITQLYKMPNIFVISRGSAFTYKGKTIEIRQVAEEMGVRYVLKGSVQKSGERIRINVQLIDAVTGEHRWAENYDRQLKDVFAVQDEIMREVVTEIAVEVSMGEWARGMTHATDNYEALDYYLKGDKLWARTEKESNAQARKLFLKAVELDPKYARAIAFLGFSHLWDARFGWVKDRAQSVKQAEKLAERAVSVDDKDYLGHILLGNIYDGKRLYKEAIAAKERAIECEPNNAIAIGSLAITLMYAGRPEEGLVLFKKMNRLSPYPYGPFLTYEGLANYLIGRYEESITLHKKYLERQKRGTYVRISRALLIASYMELGRTEEAQAEAAKWQQHHPDISIEAYTKAIKRLPLKDHRFLNRQTELLHKAGLPETPPLSLPDKPSIAVLPFVNMSGDPKQEYLSDGITESIIAALSKTPKLFVIARNSTFTYKGKPVKIQQVRHELGVRYVLEGSIQRYVDYGVDPDKSGPMPMQKIDSLRITAKLVDAKTGYHLWAERYDRELMDIFALQDEITKKILTALQLKLTEGEEIRVYAKGTDNLGAYLKFLQGRRHFNRYNKEFNAMAKQLAKEIIALDPEYAAGYSLLAKTYYSDVVLKSTNSPKKSIDLATEMAQKAISLDPSLADAHGLLGFLYTMRRQHDKGIAQAEKAIALNPNSATAYHWYGLTLVYAGRYEEAITFYKKAIRLNPFPPPRFYMSLGVAYSFAGRYEEAIAAAGKAIDLEPDNLIAHACMARSYALMGREEEARAEAKEVLRIAPKFSVVYLAKQMPYKYEADRQSVIESLRKAGLPD